jgi:hypothetical protein
VIIGAGALSLVIGSPDVMVAQIDHLKVLNKRGNVDIRVLPWRVGAHLGLSGAFTLMDFHDPDDPRWFTRNLLAGARYLEQEAQVAEYRRTFTLLSQQAVRSRSTHSELHQQHRLDQGIREQRRRPVRQMRRRDDAIDVVTRSTPRARAALHRAEFAAWLDGAKNGEFDHLA